MSRNKAKFIETGEQICNQGHLFTPENTYVNPKGVKVCRTCSKESYARHKENIRALEKRRASVLV